MSKNGGKGRARLLLAAPKSGSGKTMLTCGLISLLKNRGLRVASMKCGPDYIDPMFHRQVLGISSGNLDTFFTEEETTRYLLGEKAKAADITVLEGVMGFFDGLGGETETASTYETARVTQTPVLLVVDAKGASVSLAAVIKGMVEYRSDSQIQGVLLNRVSEGYYERIKKVIEKECGVKVFGFVPEMPGLAVPSRHLGLVAPEEVEEFSNQIETLAKCMERSVDVEGIIELARGALPCEGKKPEIPLLPNKVRLAVARDEAFSFYYEENMELLERMGAELCYFSPLHEKGLPEDIDGLILGGGYPECYVKELEAAGGMRKEIRIKCEKGLPCLAECGGFLYLQQELEGSSEQIGRVLEEEEGSGGWKAGMQEKRIGQMAGVLEGKGFSTGKLCRFGYIEATCSKGGVLGEAGWTIKGHEFHYWDSTENGGDFLAKKPVGGKGYGCIVHTASMAAGFPHLYYYSNVQMIYQFLLSCLSYQAGRKAKEHWDDIAKPIDSLGLLEDAVMKLCRVALNPKPYDISRRALVILCADHGVVKEGVTQTGSGVTRIVSENFAKGHSTVNHMARCADVDVYTVDIGMDTPPYRETELRMGAVIHRKIARGSNNLAVEPAMTIAQCRQAVETGMELVRKLKEKGYRLIVTGEMGIGNTTPASVLAALLLKVSVDKVTGKGAGLSAEGMERKRQVVERAVWRVREKGVHEPMELLAEAGGYEIAGMTGIFLGGVKYRIPILIDGAISAMAALAAAGMDSRVPDYAFASHVSEEATGRMALEALGMEAILHGHMCLGEGTGAVAVLPVLDMALAVYREMGEFGEYGIAQYVRYC